MCIRTIFNSIKWLACATTLLFGVPDGLSAAENAGTGDVLVVDGRIKRCSYEGGFYAIEGNDGNIYKPLELDASFQVEGLRVKAELRPIKEDLIFHSWGTPVEVVDIERQRDTR